MMNFEMLDNSTKGTVIKVVGVGGAGGNAVAHMIRNGVNGVDFICANTDAQALAATNAPVQIMIPPSNTKDFAFFFKFLKKFGPAMNPTDATNSTKPIFWTILE